jgi:hypothetical protein
MRQFRDCRRGLNSDNYVLQASDLAQLLRQAPVAAASTADGPAAAAEGGISVRRLLLDVARLLLPASALDCGQPPSGPINSADASSAAAVPLLAALPADADAQYVAAWVAAAASAAQPQSRSGLHRFCVPVCR